MHRGYVVGMNPKQMASLKAAIEFRLDEADRATAIAMNHASADVAQAQVQAGSRAAVVYAGVVSTEGDRLVGDLKELYTTERSKLLREDTALRTEVKTAINRYFEYAERFCPKDPFPNSPRPHYLRMIEEERGRDLAAMDDHLRRPGLKPPWERFPFLFGGATVAGLVLLFLDPLVKKLIG